MAATLRNVSRLLLQDKRLISAIFVRNTRYDTNYLENTLTYEGVKEPLPENDLRRYRKIKAAGTDDYTFADFDPVVQKFTNMVMEQGKKQLARRLVARAFEYVKRHQVEMYHKSDADEKDKIELDPVVVFQQALENGKPSLILKKVVKSGQSYQVPIAATDKRQNFLSMKWLIEASNEKDKNMRFYVKLGKEILLAYKNEGGLIKRKQDMHKQCETNKAFAHLS